MTIDWINDMHLVYVLDILKVFYCLLIGILSQHLTLVYILYDCYVYVYMDSISSYECMYFVLSVAS